MVICRNFLGLWLVNTEKPVSLRDSDVQTFLEGEENQNTKRKTESCFSKGIFRGWEENWQLEDLSLADFGRVPE